MNKHLLTRQEVNKRFTHLLDCNLIGQNVTTMLQVDLIRLRTLGLYNCSYIVLVYTKKGVPAYSTTIQQLLDIINALTHSSKDTDDKKVDEEGDSQGNGGLN